MTENEFMETLEAVDPKPLRTLVFVVPGTPVAKGRPKFARRGGFVQAYTPAKTQAYESTVQAFASEAMERDPRLFMGPLSVDLEVVVSIPASGPKKRQAAAIAGAMAPTKKPDLDNVAKALLDGMNGYVFNDDAQVVELSMRKRYGEPGVRVVVKELPMDAA